MDAPSTSTWHMMARRLCSVVNAYDALASSTARRKESRSRRYGSHSASRQSEGRLSTRTCVGLAACRGVSACVSPPAVTWSWFPGIITAGTRHLEISASASTSGSTGMAPRACQKSPRKMIPASRSSAVSCTALSTCMATGAVLRLTCRSLNTTHRLHSACFSPSASSARRSSARSGVPEEVVGWNDGATIADPPDDPLPAAEAVFAVFSPPEEDGESVATARVSGRAPRAHRRGGRALHRWRAA